MRTVIISDLHLGNGGPYDVFEGGEALPAFLDHLAPKGGPPLFVLVNGDGVDFLMNDDPLELDEARAEAQAEAIVKNSASAAVLRAFGRVLAHGGDVTIRLGNHDVELAFERVQEVFRRALGQPAGIAARLAFVHGDEEESAAMESFLDENAICHFADDDGVLTRAGTKVAKVALSIYGKLQRRLTGKEGDTYFVLEPTDDEWKEARRLGEKFRADAVIIGHTHAARWKQADGLVYANTGTWIGLMQLPRSDATDVEWAEYLHELRENKELVSSKQKRAAILRRFTAVIAEPAPSGGAALSLVEWDGKTTSVLGQTLIRSAS